MELYWSPEIVPLMAWIHTDWNGFVDLNFRHPHPGMRRVDKEKSHAAGT
jgi:hypothetical protein